MFAKRPQFDPCFVRLPHHMCLMLVALIAKVLHTNVHWPAIATFVANHFREMSPAAGVKTSAGTDAPRV
jgi:hypothetical protein